MLAPLPESQWGRDKVAHLLKRAGFGTTPEELENWAGLKMNEAVDRLLDWREQAPDPLPNPEWAKPDPTLYKKREELRALPEEERKMAQRELQRNERQHVEQLREWWLLRMLKSPHPLQEKLVLFWHGHFATSVEKVRNAYYMWRQNDIFRRLGAGNFEELLVESGRDPAMLIWLDGEKSNLRAPNENYAREVMELFTLGEGHYTEDDIKNAAKAFTGWIVDQATESAQFKPNRFSNTPKTFKNQTGNFNDTDIARIILNDPECPRYVARKLWTFFAYENPEPELVDALAGVFTAAHYEIKPLLRSMLLSQEFYSAKCVSNQIKSPVQWLVGSLKSLQIDRMPRFAPNALRLLGQDLLAPPSVKGWDGGRSWISTSTLLSRNNIARFMVYGGSPASMGIMPPNLEKAEQKGKLTESTPGTPGPGQPATAVPVADPGDEKRRRQLQVLAQMNIPPPTDVHRLLPPDNRADDEKVIAALADRMYQTPLSNTATEAFKKYLSGGSHASADDKIRGLIYLMMTRSEFQLT